MSSKTPIKSGEKIVNSDDKNTDKEDSIDDEIDERTPNRTKIHGRKSIREISPFSNDSIEYEEVLQESYVPSTRTKIYQDLSGYDEITIDSKVTVVENKVTLIRGRKNQQNVSGSPGREDRSEKRERTPFPAQVETTRKDNSFHLIIIALIFVIFAVIAYGVFSKQSITPLNNKILSIDCSKIMSLNEKYNNQDRKLFKSLQAGIEGIKRTPQVPSVVTFFSTDENAINAVLRDVIKIAKDCINQKFDPLLLTYEDFNIKEFFKDNSKVITKYKTELEKKTIMVIKEVDLINSTVVGSLHSFADTYNPLVSKSILYLTVKVPNEPSGNKANYIYTYLQNQWKDLASNIRDPLITRFIDQTFYINHIS